MKFWQRLKLFFKRAQLWHVEFVAYKGSVPLLRMSLLLAGAPNLSLLTIRAAKAFVCDAAFSYNLVDTPQQAMAVVVSVFPVSGKDAEQGHLVFNRGYGVGVEDKELLRVFDDKLLERYDSALRELRAKQDELFGADFKTTHILVSDDDFVRFL